MLSVISTFVLCLIGFGWRYRKQPKLHISFMSMAFLIDIALLLYIEVTRHAISTVKNHMEKMSDSGLLYIHVVISLIMLALYLVQIVTGIMISQRRLQIHPSLHGKIGITFVVFRLLNYVTSFFVPASLLP